MDKPVVGVFTVSETRDEFYEKRKDIVVEECDKFKKVFSQDFDMIFSEPIRSVDSSLYWALETQKRGADAVIAFSKLPYGITCFDKCHNLAF